MSEEANQDASKKAASNCQEAAAPGAGAGAECDVLDASTNVSQTHVTQMTASSEPPVAENTKWICEVCTYENYPLSRKCTMCRSSKPLLGEDIFKLQDGASALPTQDDCGEYCAEAVTERLKPLRISSPQGQPCEGASSVNKWPCPTCTYENWPKAVKCAMCGAACPPPAPAPPSPTPSRTAGTNDICNSQNLSLHEVDSNTRRTSKRRTNNVDWIWLQACLGVVEGDERRVEAYLASGGDPARALAPHELPLLDRASAFDVGHTLVHLAIRFQRQEILANLLSRISGGGSGIKRSPSYIAPDLAAAIRRHMASCIRVNKGNFLSRYMTEFCTFYLPAEITELPGAVQQQVFDEVLDREAQRALEGGPRPAVNFSGELTARLRSRLFALWNRSAGDCLPDAAAQAAYGVADRGQALRAALAAAMAAPLYARWAAWERLQAARPPAPYAPSEPQLRGEWARLAAAAARPGAALRQPHVFALAHVLRRPLLVLGVELVASHRGEPLGYARFRGLYLPLLWDPDRCSKSPLCLGYTRGHFSALVPMEPYRPRRDYICRDDEEETENVTYLPLTDSEGKLLPVHYLTCEEMADTEGVMRRWLSACVTRGGVLAARQTLHPRPLLQAQMLEEWLNHYRRLAQQSQGPFPPRLSGAELSSDPDTDEE